MAAMSVSGVISGMDWESMIDEIITNAAKPAQVKVNKKTNLTNKKSLFEEMKVMMNSLQSSLSALKLPSTYKAKTIDIERLDKNTSYKGVLTATANADAEVNVWEVKVNKLATAQINRSKQITDSSLASTLSGVSGKTIYINSGGQKVGVEVKSTDTLESLKSRINTALTELESPLYITASVVDNKLIMKSDYTGKGTMTAKETVNYNYSTGINRLSNISIPSNAVDNVKITSGSKSYVIHKDFEVANGNEIRWKQYDRGDEVALGDSVDVKYTMAAGDVYEAKGTAGGTEAALSGFNKVDNGTLASRLKIVEKNDPSKIYEYGKDFELDSSGKVKWLEAEAARTNEPSSYTVSYDKNEVKTATAQGTKSAAGPTSYTVSYAKTQQIASPTWTWDGGGNQTIQYSFSGTPYSSTSYNGFLSAYANAEELDSTAGLSVQSNDAIGTTNYYYMTNVGSISIDGYEYGKDYVLRQNFNNGGAVAISWNATYDGATTATGATYVADYRKNILIPSDTSPVTGRHPAEGTEYTINYTHTYKYDTDDTDDTGDTLSEVLGMAMTDSGGYSGLVITDKTNYRTYSYDNGDFSVIGGQIVWNLTNDDNIDVSDVATQYNTVNGTDEIPRVTLTDGNGVLRTYLDLAGDSSFTMTDENGKTYEYGRDYVIRVNDSGDGYSVTWAIASDANGDGKQDINDASTVLTTYAQYKELSTYGMQIAPDVDTDYNFTFTGTATTSKSATVNKTDEDAKLLLNLFSDITIAPADYSTALTITDSSGKKYEYGTDWVIDAGKITWIEQSAPTTPNKPTGEYTITYKAFALDSESDCTYDSNTSTYDVSLIDHYGYSTEPVSYENVLEYAGVSSADGTTLGNFLTLKDEDGKVYTYGTDYKLVKSDTTGNTQIEWLTGDNATQPANGKNFTLTMTGIESISTTVTRSASDTPLSATYSELKEGTVTITQGTKTYYEGVDFTLSKESEASDAKAIVNWIPDSKDGYEWYYPNPGSTYTVNLTDKNGNKTTYTGYRSNYDTLDMKEKFNLTSVNGSVIVKYGDGVSYNLNSDATYTVNGTDYDVQSMVRSAYSVDVTKPEGGTSFNFRWLTPSQTTHSNLPSMNEELTIEYGYDANTFDLADDADGKILEALGFTDSGGNYVDYTAADDAELVVAGQTVTVDSNDIGEAYENEIIKGVTLHLKGTGTVSLDISHDAEKAVESIQTFVDNYNDLMTWMNTRMTEKQVDEDTKATIDSDDFRMRWGLLHGNSLLRQTKSTMRSIVSQNFTFSFTQRKSSEEVYGRMSYNGLKSSSTLRLRIGSKFVDVTIDPDDTLETIVAKINDDTKNGPMHNIYYDDDGNKLQSPLLKASVENDKLVINSTSSDEITMSGSAAMNALKMNYTYRGLYQIGIETTSDDYGKSGELVFDADEFMTALEDNPDEVQSLMVAFANQFNTWTRSMLNSSASGETSGTLTREIENIQSQIDTINEYLENYQNRLDRMEENLRTRYGNTETQFSRLTQQANSIAAILNQLNGTAQGGGYGQTSS